MHYVLEKQIYFTVIKIIDIQDILLSKILLSGPLYKCIILSNM